MVYGFRSYGVLLTASSVAVVYRSYGVLLTASSVAVVYR